MAPLVLEPPTPSGVAGIYNLATPPMPTESGAGLTEGVLPTPPLGRMRLDEVDASPTPDWYGEAGARINELSRLEADWNGYGSPAPTQAARDHARVVLDRLLDASLKPDRVLAESSGGLTFYFLRGQRGDRSSRLRARIVCDNSGQISCVLHNRESGNITMTQLDADGSAIDRAIDHLRVFLDE